MLGPALECASCSNIGSIEGKELKAQSGKVRLKETILRQTILTTVIGFKVRKYKQEQKSAAETNR